MSSRKLDPHFGGTADNMAFCQTLSNSRRRLGREVGGLGNLDGPRNCLDVIHASESLPAASTGWASSSVLDELE
ncbi:unnamed protein product [Strongylus vulgaris]|uniref:Uncharacterized protein n=1 Tax=Strongylus vulgaris TaxID=40348 RepID=A0A3P7IVS4_STRVU|nr:unnamed protein product [Strongylus vulgaris]